MELSAKCEILVEGVVLVSFSVGVENGDGEKILRG